MSTLTVLAQPIDTSASLRLIGHRVVKNLDKRLDYLPQDDEVVPRTATVCSMALDADIINLWLEVSQDPRVVAFRARIILAAAGKKERS